MKIKTKLNLGLGLLFLLIILLALFSINQINLLGNAARNIIKDNKETITYSNAMLKALSELDKNASSMDTIAKYLARQKENITEIGEKNLTESLEMHFGKLKLNPDNTAVIHEMRTVIFKIIDVNLEAIKQKNSIAITTTRNSIIFISLLSAISFSIALLVFLRLPANISNPIKELTQSIKKIAGNDYSQRVNFENHSDMGELAISFNVMANKLEEYNRSNVSKLLAEKKITETLINKIHYSIIGFDKSMKITLVNDEFIKISGLNRKELIGGNVLEIAAEKELIGQIIIMDSAKPRNFSSSEPNKKIRLDVQGKDIHYEKEVLEIAYTAQNSPDKHVLGHVIVLTNITEYMELHLARTNFIATVSHELKTPISAIKFCLQLLENEKTGPLNKDQLELIKSCDEDTDNLLKIISELLVLIQVDTGNMLLNIQPTRIEEILQFAISTNKPSADRRKIDFDLEIPSNVQEVMADKEKTGWVLSNLISNAIHYSDEESSIKIVAKEGNKEMKIEIQDFGPGIDSQYKTKIFNRFFRVPGTKKEGTGLGLAICKEFIEAQGGRIEVESEPGNGSTFTVYLNCKSENDGLA